MDSVKYFRALARAGAAINSSLNPAEVLNTIVQEGAEAMEVKGCALLILTSDRRNLQHSADFGLSKAFIEKGTLQSDVEDALKGLSVAVPSVADQPSLQHREGLIREGVEAMLSVPVRLHGNVVGIMRMYSSRQREFSDIEVEFAEAVANFGAIALDNARLCTATMVDLEALKKYIYM